MKNANKFLTLFETKTDLAMQNLEKEYLKMNRLTQKIINYFLEMLGKRNQDKFLIFLVRVIFGEHYEFRMSYETYKNSYFSAKERFRIFVANHLKAAEELTKSQKIHNLNDDKSEIKIINNRLGNLLFPPERAIKFNSILNTSNLTQISRKSKNLNIPKTARLIRNSKNPKHNLPISSILKNQNKSNSNGLIIPTVRKVSFHSIKDSKESQRKEIDNDRNKRMNYLKYQISFYQKRLHDFYNKLESIAKYKKNKNQIGFEKLVTQKNLKNEDFETKYNNVSNQNLLFKRSYSLFQPTPPYFNKNNQ
jgi:hypothetical protein